MHAGIASGMGYCGVLVVGSKGNLHDPQIAVLFAEVGLGPLLV